MKCGMKVLGNAIMFVTNILTSITYPVVYESRLPINEWFSSMQIKRTHISIPYCDSGHVFSWHSIFPVVEHFSRASWFSNVKVFGAIFVATYFSMYNFAQRSLWKLGISMLKIWMKFSEGILMHTKVRLKTVLLMFSQKTWEKPSQLLWTFFFPYFIYTQYSICCSQTAFFGILWALSFRVCRSNLLTQVLYGLGKGHPFHLQAFQDIHRCFFLTCLTSHVPAVLTAPICIAYATHLKNHRHAWAFWYYK